MFDLRAVKRIFHRQIFDEIRAIQDAAVLLHVVKLDSEAVRRGSNFFGRQQQQRRAAFRTPPRHHRLRLQELARRDLAERTEHVQIRVLLVPITHRRRSVENDGDELIGQGRLEPLD